LTLWARLTWQAAVPDAFAAGLAARLGVAARQGGGVPGAWTIGLGVADLEVRPWLRESPSDDPVAEGRLVLEPVPGGEEPADASDEVPLVLAGLGWATVELDRAEDELGPWLGSATAGRPGRELAESLLGARARVRGAAGLPGEAIVLLEPATEGRLAASLARDGEGPCALYLRPAAGLPAWAAAAASRGVDLGAHREGPLGRGALLLGGPVAGPHLILLDAS
jgi:hypothetical protein